MYKEDKKNIGWLKIIVKVVIFFLIFMLVVKLISMVVANYRDNNETDYMKDNLKIMDKVAKEYFSDENLPDKLGKTNKVTLSTLLEKELIEELKDEEGNSCSLENSFIQATRLDSEYQLKSYLECGKDSDYSNTFIKIDNKQTIKVEGTTTTAKKDEATTTTTVKKATTTTKKKTTKKVTTSTKAKTTTTTTTKVTVRLTYSVTFNTNGGTFIPEQSIKPGSKIANVVPKREGYKFVGWYYNGKEFDVNTAINRDYVLVAKWVKE